MQIDVPAILKRAKTILDVRTDSDLARKLGINRATLCNWKTRNTLNYELLLSKCEMADFDWLIRGEESQTRNTTNNRINETLDALKAQVDYLTKQIDELKIAKRGLPKQVLH